MNWKYEILEELGRGGMGVVYKARQVDLKRIVALKMLLVGQHSGAKERARFNQEADLIARLRHPHIVQIFEKGERDGVPFLAMEYCERGSLAQHFGDRPQAPIACARAVKDLAEAIACAHAQNIVHRDLKPDNVLVTGDGEFKITDFGLALLLEDGQTRLTTRGALVGTPAYMSPEQAAGYEHLDAAADIYGLGGILYTLLTGRPPFTGKRIDEVLKHVLGTEPVRPRVLEPDVPRDLETICLKCLTKQPRYRYASAAALAADLDRFLKNEPIAARPIGTLSRGWRWCQRNRVVAGLSAAALALLVFAALSATIAAFLFSARAASETSARLALEEQLYDNHIAIAERELTLNQDIDLADKLLQKCPERLRGWEWDYLMRLRDGVRPPLIAHEAGLWAGAFSPDGTCLATASIDGTVRVWDADTSKVLLTFRGHDLLPFALPIAGIPHVPVKCLTFSPDGKHIASGSFSPQLDNLKASRGSIKIWEVKTGRQLITFQEQVGVILSIAYQPDGARIASSSINPDNTFVVWNPRTGAVIKVISGHASHIHKLRYSPDGKVLASSSTDGTVKLWDAASLREIRSITAHPATVVDIAFAPDSLHFATAGQDGTVGVWHTATGEETLRLRGHTGAALGVTYSPDGKRIASTGFDKTVRLWDAVSGKEKITLRGHEDTVWTVSFSPDGRRLLSASYDKQARIWDATPHRGEVGPGLFTLTGHRDRVNGVAFSADGRLLASGGWDFDVRLADARTGDHIRTLKGHKGAVFSVSFDPDSKRLASASWDHSVKIWDTESGRALVTFEGHIAPVHSVAFSPDGKRVVSAGFDAVAKIWDAATGKELVAADGYMYPIFAVAFSPDGKRIASGRGDRSVVIWDAANGKTLFTLKGHAGAVHCVAFSPDGKRLVSGSWDHTLKVWQVEPESPALFSSRELLTLEGHRDRVHGVAFSPDGSRIASASEDKTVRIWDAVTGKEVMPPRLHRGVLWSVAFDPHGKRVASGCWSVSGWVKTWNVANENAAAAASR